MNYTTSNQRDDGTQYQKGDDWSERILRRNCYRLLSQPN